MLRIRLNWSNGFYICQQHCYNVFDIQLDPNNVIIAILLAHLLYYLRYAFRGNNMKIAAKSTVEHVHIMTKQDWNQFKHTSLSIFV